LPLYSLFREIFDEIEMTSDTQWKLLIEAVEHGYVIRQGDYELDGPARRLENRGLFDKMWSIDPETKTLYNAGWTITDVGYQFYLKRFGAMFEARKPWLIFKNKRY
jgi:hypothetical protein